MTTKAITSECNHPESSPQGQLGAALLAMRKRSPKAPLSKLHDKLLKG